MLPRNLIRKLRRDEKGVTIVEFAIILLPMCMIIMIGIDLAWQAFATATTRGALQKAARSGTIESATLANVSNAFRTDVRSFAHPIDVSLTAQNFKTYAGIGSPEKVTIDSTPTGGAAETGDCYEDANNNGSWDANQGTSGIGTSDDIVRYTATVQYDRLFPLTSWIGMSNRVTISMDSLTRVEPYAAAVPVSVRCVT